MTAGQNIFELLSIVYITALGDDEVQKEESQFKALTILMTIAMHPSTREPSILQRYKEG